MSEGADPNGYALYLSKFLSETPNFYCDYKSQIGLGFKSLGHSRFMSVAAPEVCQSLSDFSSFVAVFVVPEGFWLIAVRNGVILSDQDKLYQTEQEAKDAYKKLLSLPDWGLKIAPSSWGIEHSIEKQVYEVFLGLARRQLKKIRLKENVYFSILFFAAIFFTLFFIFKKQIINFIAPKPQSLNINEEMLDAYKKKISEPKQTQIVKKSDILKTPYDSLSDINDFSKQCYKAITYLMYPIPGWDVLDVECIDGSISARLKRNYGNFQELRYQVEKNMKGVELEQLGDNDVILFSNLPEVKKVSIKPKYTAEEAKIMLTSFFDKLNMPIKITLKKDIIENSDPMKTKTYEYIKIEADSKIKPTEFIYALKSLESVSLNNVKWDNKKQIWIYEGETYVK